MVAKRESKQAKIARVRKERNSTLGKLGKALKAAGIEVSSTDLSKAFPSKHDAKSRLEKDLKKTARSRAKEK